MSLSTLPLKIKASGRATAVGIFDALAPRLDALYRSYVEDPYGSTFVYSRKKIDMVIDGALAELPPGARVLDAGCGTGFHLARLRARGFDAAGVEPGDRLRALASANNPGTTIENACIERLPFPDASFDVALAVEVLRYLPDPGAAASEMARVLRPGGLAVVTLPSQWSMNGYALINGLTSRVHVPTFMKVKQRFFTERSARQLIRQAGFSTVQIHGVAYGPWQAVERLSPSLVRLVLRAFEPIDDRLSKCSLLRNVSGMLVVVARR